MRDELARVTRLREEGGDGAAARRSGACSRTGYLAGGVLGGIAFLRYGFPAFHVGAALLGIVLARGLLRVRSGRSREQPMVDGTSAR